MVKVVEEWIDGCLELGLLGWRCLLFTGPLVWPHVTSFVRLAPFNKHCRRNGACGSAHAALSGPAEGHGCSCARHITKGGRGERKKEEEEEEEGEKKVSVDSRVLLLGKGSWEFLETRSFSKRPRLGPRSAVRNVITKLIVTGMSFMSFMSFTVLLANNKKSLASLLPACFVSTLDNPGVDP